MTTSCSNPTRHRLIPVPQAELAEKIQQCEELKARVAVAQSSLAEEKASHGATHAEAQTTTLKLKKALEAERKALEAELRLKKQVAALESAAMNAPGPGPSPSSPSPQRLPKLMEDEEHTPITRGRAASMLSIDNGDPQAAVSRYHVSWA